MKPSNLLKSVLFLLPVAATSQVQPLLPDSNSTVVFKLKKQPRFYLTVHGGYSVALGSTFKFYPDDVNSISVQMIENSAPSKNISYSATTKGLGEGARFGAGLSYIINDFINVGIDFDYLSTSISKNRDSTFYQVKKSEGIDYRYTERYNITYKAKLLTISPNITFKAISRPRFFIYNKIGAILTFRPNSIQTENQDAKMRMAEQGFVKDSSSKNTKRYEWGIRNPAFGFMGAIGMQVKITGRIRAYGEIQFTHVVFAVKNRVLTNYTLNGREMVKTLTRAEKEIEFEKNYTDDEWSNNPNQPARATRQRFPISYIGFQAGLAYRF